MNERGDERRQRQERQSAATKVQKETLGWVQEAALRRTSRMSSAPAGVG